MLFLGDGAQGRLSRGRDMPAESTAPWSNVQAASWHGWQNVGTWCLDTRDVPSDSRSGSYTLASGTVVVADSQFAGRHGSAQLQHEIQLALEGGAVCESGNTPHVSG